MQERGPAAYIAEFIGTFALVFFITAAVSLYVTPPTPTNPTPFIDFGVIGLVHVFVLFMLIQTLAVASGAHFNPAVTAAMTALRQIRPADAGDLRGLPVRRRRGGRPAHQGAARGRGRARSNYGAVALNDRIDGAVFPGMVVEFIGTFFLVWVIVGVAVNPRGRQGLGRRSRSAPRWACVVMVLAPLTGAGFNPARAFGPALVADAFNGGGDFILVYVLAPVLGALAAALAYHKLYITPGAKEPGGMEPVG